MLVTKKDGTDGREAKRAVGERSEAAVENDARREPPDPELVERPKRRRFTTEYKLRILRETDACTKPGDVGALLRREGLYSSLLSEWRKRRDEGAFEAFSRRRGRKLADRRDKQIAELNHQLEHSEAELAKARKVIEVQGNVSALLGDLLEPRGATKTESTEQ